MTYCFFFFNYICRGKCISYPKLLDIFNAVLLIFNAKHGSSHSSTNREIIFPWFSHSSTNKEIIFPSSTPWKWVYRMWRNVHTFFIKYNAYCAYPILHFKVKEIIRVMPFFDQQTTFFYNHCHNHLVLWKKLYVSMSSIIELDWLQTRVPSKFLWILDRDRGVSCLLSLLTLLFSLISCFEFWQLINGHIQ